MDRMERHAEKVCVGVGVAVFFSVLLLSLSGGDESLSLGVSLANGIVGGALAFAMVMLFFARRIVTKLSARLIGAQEKLSEKLADAQDKIEEANGSLATSTAAIESMNSSIERHTKGLADVCDGVRELVFLGLRNLGLAPDLKKTTVAFEKEESACYELMDRVTHAFHKYANAWEYAGENRSIYQDRDATMAWSYFVQSYLRSEAETISVGRLQTSPRIYTRLVTEIARSFQQDSSGKTRGKEKILLFLATAMLPSEFFNWPQAELHLGSRKLEFVPHTWWGVEEYIASLSRLSKMPSLKIRRCILVSGMSEPPVLHGGVPYIHSFTELQEQANLWLLDRPRTHSKLKAARMTELLGAMTSLDDEYISGFARVANFQFYPVGTKDVFNKGYFDPTGRLLEIFVRRLHSKNNDARYYSLIAHEMELYETLFRDPDHMPEIAMFGIEEKNVGTEASKVRWLFGIIGYLRPFTEYMEVEFVIPSDQRSDRLLKAIDTLNQGSIALPSLLQR